MSRALALLPAEARRACALAGGDDYELCFTAPAAARAAVERIGERENVPVTRIGTIERHRFAGGPRRPSPGATARARRSP